MEWLVDTSILARLANADDAAHRAAVEAVEMLISRGDVLRTSPQNLIEFRNCATRPVAANGLGLSPEQAQVKSQEFESLFPIVAENPDIYLAWKSLAQATGVIGKQVHDTRLVAVCQVHGLTRILTFNVQHFSRPASFVPRLVVLDPEAAVASGNSP
jgi:predicted nucleic acid-binding protein